MYDSDDDNVYDSDDDNAYDNDDDSTGKKCIILTSNSKQKIILLNRALERAPFNLVYARV